MDIVCTLRQFGETVWTSAIGADASVNFGSIADWSADSVGSSLEGILAVAAVAGGVQYFWVFAVLNTDVIGGQNETKVADASRGILIWS